MTDLCPSARNKTWTNLCPALVKVKQISLNVLFVLSGHFVIMSHPATVGVDGVQALLSGGHVIFPILKTSSDVTTTVMEGDAVFPILKTSSDVTTTVTGEDVVFPVLKPSPDITPIVMVSWRVTLLPYILTYQHNQESFR